MSLQEAPYKLPNKKKELSSARKDSLPRNRNTAWGIVVSQILMIYYLPPGIYYLLALGFIVFITLEIRPINLQRASQDSSYHFHNFSSIVAPSLLLTLSFLTHHGKLDRRNIQLNRNRTCSRGWGVCAKGVCGELQTYSLSIPGNFYWPDDVEDFPQPYQSHPLGSRPFW